MGIRENKSFETELWDLEIPITINDELEAVRWASKRGAGPGDLEFLLDNWKEQKDLEKSKKKVFLAKKEKEHGSSKFSRSKRLFRD